MKAIPSDQLHSHIKTVYTSNILIVSLPTFQIPTKKKTPTNYFFKKKKEILENINTIYYTKIAMIHFRLNCETTFLINYSLEKGNRVKRKM